MSQSRWSRLDNVAKIFPPTSDRKDTRVFRFACELHEDVDPEILQHALDKAMHRFEYYRSVLKKGFFWYYLEESSRQPVVIEESYPPLSPIYNPNKKGLLFQVSYYRHRINFDIYHVLSDGTGALAFLRVLVMYYLFEKYKDEFGEEPPRTDYDASSFQIERDSFAKYYNKEKAGRTAKRKAYVLRGEENPESRFGIVEGLFSVNALIDIAHEHDATLSEFLTAVMISAIHNGMSRMDERRPVVISVPVNLRRYFPSQTSRNFFSVIDVGHQFGEGEDDIPAILQSIRADFARELQPENLEKKINSYMALEHNMLARFIPLALKIPSLRMANWVAEKTHTATFSNVGRVDMPEPYRKYIRLFDVFSSTRTMQVCLCSFGDNMLISFASALRSNDIQREFFRSLTRAGADCVISTNIGDFEEVSEE